MVLGLAASGCGDEPAGVDAGRAVEDTTVEVRESDREEAAVLPTCDEQWAEGNVVSQAELELGCVETDGGVTVHGAAGVDCKDGRVLRWNDRAWWYEGESLHAHADDAAELTAPHDVREACERA